MPQPASSVSLPANSSGASCVESIAAPSACTAVRRVRAVTIDGEVSLIGSANLDRRSFDLNYENNILLQSRDLTAEIRARQETYLADSREVHLAEVLAWSAPKRLWNNTVGMMGPVL